jgi:hypothetical protein
LGLVLLVIFDSKGSLDAFCQLLCRISDLTPLVRFDGCRCRHGCWPCIKQQPVTVKWPVELMPRRLGPISSLLSLDIFKNRTMITSVLGSLIAIINIRRMLLPGVPLFLKKDECSSDHMQIANGDNAGEIYYIF